MDQRQAPTKNASSGIKDIRHKFNSMVCPLDCKIESGTSAFSASLESVRLGALDVVRFDGRYGLRGGGRSFRHIQENETTHFLVALPLTASVSISQSGRSTIVEPGACFMLNTARPFEGLCGSHAYSELVIRIPDPILRHHVPYIEDCCARPIDLRHGIGKIFRSMVESLVEETDEYSDSQADRLGALLLSAIANVALESPELADLQISQRQSAHARIFDRAKKFIESNLSNPELGPGLVAAHCRISTSYLHAAFAASSQNVGALIREMRLQRCREGLRSPALRHQSITQIAIHWGFNSSSSFYHIYRARFGKSPSEDRVSLIAT